MLLLLLTNCCVSQGAPLLGSLILNPNLKPLDFGKGQVVRHLGNTELCFKEGGAAAPQ